MRGPCVFSAAISHKKLLFYPPFPWYVRKYCLFTLETYLIGYLDPKNIYFFSNFRIVAIKGDIAYFLQPFSMKNSYFTPNCLGKYENIADLDWKPI